MDRLVANKTYQMWWNNYRHICDTVEEFREWLADRDYYKEITERYDQIKLLKIGAEYIVMPKVLWQRLFLLVGKGYELCKATNKYRVRMAFGGRVRYFGSYEDEESAAEQYLRVKTLATLNEFQDSCPSDMLRDVINEFVISYGMTHGKIKIKDFLI